MDFMVNVVGYILTRAETVKRVVLPVVVVVVKVVEVVKV